MPSPGASSRMAAVVLVTLSANSLAHFWVVGSSHTAAVGIAAAVETSSDNSQDHFWAAESRAMEASILEDIPQVAEAASAAL